MILYSNNKMKLLKILLLAYHLIIIIIEYLFREFFLYDNYQINNINFYSFHFPSILNTYIKFIYLLRYIYYWS